MKFFCRRPVKYCAQYSVIGGMNCDELCVLGKGCRCGPDGGYVMIATCH